MSYPLWRFLRVARPALTVAVPLLVLAAIWLGEWRLGTTAFVAAVSALACFGALDCTPEPPPRLTRADRKRIRDEERRIAVDRAIRRAEREAGIE